MKISVVIPLYNKELHIARAIDSVLNQSIQVDEIIVVDDGSTDGSGEVVKSHYGSRVCLIQQANRGECGARNRGIEEATGEFVGFLDADDEWKPGFLRQITRLFNNFPDCGAYATSSEIIRPDGQIAYPNLGNLPPAPWIGIIPNIFELFQLGYPFGASSIVIPKTVLEDVGKFPLGVSLSGDVVCWINIGIRYPIAFSPTPSIIYHQEAQNRVGNRFLPLEEMPYVRIIQDAISNNVISKELQPAALDFFTQKQIFIAVKNIMAGNPAYARWLLSTCWKTKKYRRDWLWWRFWASFPKGLPLQILKMKQVLQRGFR